MRKSAIIFSVLVLFSIITGCSKETAKPDQEKKNKLQVYTTVYPLQFFSEQIGGEFVNAKTIYPPGADEHTFEPSQKDMMTLADADLFLYIGLGLEGFVDKASQTLKDEDVSMLAVGDKINFTEKETVHEEEDHHEDDPDGNHQEEEAAHDHSGIDPHVWLDPIYAQEMALAIKDQLSSQLPEQKATFEKNYLKLADQLETLDQQFKDVFAAPKRQEIIVSHSAYGYWEKRYGLKQLSISGLSTTNEPSQKELQKLIAHAKNEKIRYVLNEQNFDSKLAKMVQNEIGAKSLTLHNLSVLTDEDVKDKATYFTLMEENIATLKKAVNE